MDHILTTHTGSLARPPALRDMLLARASGLNVDSSNFATVVREAVQDVVRKQVETGLSMVNDGEQSKIGFAAYVKDRLYGYETRDTEPRPLTGDQRDFPGWAAEHRGPGPRPIGHEPLSWKDFSAVDVDIANLRTATEGLPIERVFMTAVSPGTLVNHQANRAYKTREMYLAAAADTMRREYQAIVDAGFLLQIDSPDLAASRDTFYADLTDDEFIRLAEQNVEALNDATREIPAEQIRVHVCWGAGEGPHANDIELRKVASVLLRARARALSIVAANGRHQHEWRVWQEVKLPDGKVLVPGVIDSTTNVVEHPETVAERIVRYANILGRENVMAGVDCGFGTGVSAAPPRVHPEVVWAKLRSLVEGARLASERLWGR